MRVIFMGTPEYAKAILETLIADSEIEVVGVFTQPDKPVGRKKVLTPPEVKVLAQANNIEVYQPTSLKKERFEERIRELKPDYIVVAAFGQILPKSILDIAPCINLHASILPKYRGASPIQEVLLDGETQTGVTAMLMDVGMDTGDILSIERFAISKMMVAGELFEALTAVAAKMTPNVLKAFNTLTPVKQNDADASHCKKIRKEDGCIDFTASRLIENKYKAYTPWPGVFLQSGLKLKELAFENDDKSYEPGKIIQITKTYIKVGCEKGAILVKRVQPVGKKEMDIASFVNGKRLTVEDSLL